jgi:DNA-binding transcriptional LysR family regulator
VRAAVIAGIGLSVVSEWAFTPELKSGVVMSAMDDWELPPVNLSAVYPTGRLASTKARQFTAFVEQCVTT